MIAALTLSGCVNGPSAAAICDGSTGLRTDHAAALVADGGPISKQTGRALIAGIDAGCGE